MTQNQIFLPSEFPDYSSMQFWDSRYRQILTQSSAQMQQAASTSPKQTDGNVDDEWYLTYEQL